MNCYSRGRNTIDIIAKVQILQRSVTYILKKRGYKKVKPSWKPKLFPAMKTIYLVLAIKYRNQTIEDQKQIIQTNKTSIVLGQRRGNNHIWRMVEEKE